MKRIFVIYNPRSSRFSEVKAIVFPQLKSLEGFIVGKYVVEPTDVDQNAQKLAKLLQDDDLVLATGGDATATIAVNAILTSKSQATLAALPYGNFNDLSRTLGTKTLADILSNLTSPKNFYPLEILVDGRHFRFATCYVTIGMTAEAVKIYDYPAIRKSLKNRIGRDLGAYLVLSSWYFKNRFKKPFLPDFKLNGELQPSQTSDYAAINGHYMARVMKGRDDFLHPNIFRHETDRLTNFSRLCALMFKSVFTHIPCTTTTGDTLEFLAPATVTLQAEGEYRTFENIRQIEIRKDTKCLKVITI